MQNDTIAPYTHRKSYSSTYFQKLKKTQIETSCKGQCKYEIQENFPIFKTPTTLVPLHPKFFHTLTMGILFQTNPLPSPLSE